ncbi:hypothetical protein C0Z18_28030 [Trinickia dabaoshanensis]|uniref:RHS repeat-associated core domain-containing protein n=1 Tax=Trinickia dabaoshanensis TaxID=564714 RepID=A0A2N7VDD2_9BURK|nr:RHS repeat-associated core domain-containing protein [Trinickia dabaoshanensis]PMS15171.1 hypothetical protein C0Z18_28030 [Trinickia dabaoshanensis]
MTANIRIGFTGTYRDLVACGYPLGAGYRWYGPARMRFNAPDSVSPFGAGGIHPYAYCGGDPVSRADPTGRTFEALGAFAARAVSEAAERGTEDGGSLAASVAVPRARSESDDVWEPQRFEVPWTTWKSQLIADGSWYVHGSNSASLEGVAKFRALLSMEKMDGTPWFFRDGPRLPSGEFRNTVTDLETRSGTSLGISLYGFHKAKLSVEVYSSYGSSDKVFPVLYGLDNDMPLRCCDVHILTVESINLDHFRGIYVPADRVAEAKRLLLDYGSEKLSSMVYGSDIFQ